MKRLPEVLGYHIENFEKKALEMTKPLRSLKGFYTVSASSMVPLAYKEGVITGMEFLWSHGAVIQAGEFRHGPLEIVESGVPFLFLVPTDSAREITQRALQFVERWKGTAIVLDYADFAMGLHPDLAPFVMFVPLEWFCYYFSVVRITILMTGDITVWWNTDIVNKFTNCIRKGLFTMENSPFLLCIFTKYMG
ncbi:hypothetical protein LC724_25005 [Blautia sp. RD014234]|nr:hypothetical protein [Blautia parvula]